LDFSQKKKKKKEKEGQKSHSFIRLNTRARRKKLVRLEREREREKEEAFFFFFSFFCPLSRWEKRGEFEREREARFLLFTRRNSTKTRDERSLIPPKTTKTTWAGETFIKY